MLANACSGGTPLPCAAAAGDVSLITTDRLNAGPAMLRSLCERCAEWESGRAAR